MITTNNELYHHGVLGMKWGVRRKYKHTDGSLTRRGRKEFDTVSSNKRLSNKQNKQALKLLTNAEKQVNKKVSKYDKKLSKNPDNQTYIEKSKKYMQESKLLSKKISGINSGEIKAGRDFIVVNKHAYIPYAYIGLTGPKIKIHDISRAKYIIEKESSSSANKR